MPRITAVIDIGSNSARMAVFERTSRYGFHLIREVKSRVRISEDSYENDGHLQPLPMQRAFKALREFKSIAHALGARKILCVATSAMRDAPNASDLVNRVEKELGIHIRVIEGEKEAYFGALAALNLLPVRDGFTVDIGGGSTECARLEEGQIGEMVSLNLGTVRIKELFYDTKRGIEAAREFVESEFAKLPLSIRSGTAIGIGGTIRALAKTIMKMESYPIDSLHGYAFSCEKHLEVIEKIAASPVTRLNRFGIKEDRYDTIREGALILSMLLRRFGTTTVVTSGAGVREGVFLHDTLRGSGYCFPKGFNPSVRSLLDRFCHNPRCSIFQKKTALQLFETLSPLHGINRRYMMHLSVAARLANIGVALNYYGHQHHGSYFLLNSLSYGFSHQDRLIIALLVEYHDKKIPNSAQIEEVRSLLPDIALLQWLSFLLGLAEAINIAQNFPKVRLELEKETLHIITDSEMYLAKEQIKSLAKPCTLAIIVTTES